MQRQWLGVSTRTQAHIYFYPSKINLKRRSSTTQVQRDLLLTTLFESEDMTQIQTFSKFLKPGVDVKTAGKDI